MKSFPLKPLLLMGLLALAPMAHAQDLYVSDFGANAVQEFAPDGTFVKTFAANVSEPDGLASAGGFLFVASNNTDTGAGQILRFNLSDPSAPAFVFGTGLSDSITGLVADGAGSVYVSDFNASSVQEYDASGSLVSTFSVSINNPIGLAFGPSGALYAASSTDNEVYQLSGLTSASGPTVTPFAAANAPASLAFVGSTLYAAIGQGANGQGSVETYDASGTPAGTFEDGSHLTDPSSPYGLAAGAGNVFVSDQYGSTVTQYDASGTYVGTISTNLNQPLGLALAPASAPEPPAPLALLFGGTGLAIGFLRRRALTIKEL